MKRIIYLMLSLFLLVSCVQEQIMDSKDNTLNNNIVGASTKESIEISNYLSQDSIPLTISMWSPRPNETKGTCRVYGDNLNEIILSFEQGEDERTIFVKVGDEIHLEVDESERSNYHFFAWFDRDDRNAVIGDQVTDAGVHYYDRVITERDISAGPWDTAWIRCTFRGFQIGWTNEGWDFPSIPQ